MSDENTKGDRAEAVVLSTLAGRGFDVFLPFSDHSSSDLVVEVDDELHRVQVKSAAKNGEVIHGRLYKRKRSGGDEGYRIDEIDVFALYCPDVDEVYWIPYDDAPDKSIKLRYQPERDDSRYRYATEYRLDVQLPKV